MQTGIIEVDLHGMDVLKAKNEIYKVLRKAGKSVYRIRLIHGFHGGNAIKEMIDDEFGYSREEKVLRVVPGWNPGITELVLREL